ncbi:FCD domain-containing protein [Streptomyces lydicus]|uniref:FCD domain-containing protein n=1 Tax=Streptomyces lydicus TaxID=47763 RepID=UPI0036C2ADC9
MRAVRGVAARGRADAGRPGFVEPRHGSGTYVSQLRPEDIVGSLSLPLELLTLAGLLEVHEIRRVLEAHVAAQAAARCTPETVRTLFSLIEAMEATDDPVEASELDHRFHAEIALAGGLLATAIASRDPVVAAGATQTHVARTER